jgi:hypothetical protein
MHRDAELHDVLLVRRKCFRGFRVPPSRAFLGDYGKKGKLEFTIDRVARISTAISQPYTCIPATQAMIDRSDWVFYRQ